MNETSSKPSIEVINPDYCVRIRTKYRRPRQLRLITYDDILPTVRYHNNTYKPRGDVSVDTFIPEMEQYVVDYGRSGNEFGSIHAAVATLLMLSFKDDFFNGHSVVNGWTQSALAQTIRIPFSSSWDIYNEFENTFRRTIDTYYK